MKTQWIGLVFLFLTCLSRADVPTRLSLEPSPGMTRADLYYVKTVRNPKSVLVLCPGCNGNGEGLVNNPTWQEFAKKQNLGLVGLSFASEMKDIHNDQGYYYASNGSGKLLLNGINKLFGRDLPVLLYGFSGGAHFTSRFVEWKPERVIAWCAYSAGWWDEPKAAVPPPKLSSGKASTCADFYAKPAAGQQADPPGIVACGEDDERLGASLIYFKQGRAVGKPWLWIGIPANGHSPDKRVESFVKDYFEAILKNNDRLDPAKTGLWVDIDKRNPAEMNIIRQYPSITGWLPDAKLLNIWQSLNEP